MASGLLLFILVSPQFWFCYGSLPDAGLSTPELVDYWGYPVETHETQTEDGYILTLHRIPHAKETNLRNTGDKNLPVFFLLHGALGSSASFFLNLPHQSLGYMLADAGFDVWLGNTRGNRYSKNHMTLDPNSKEFWDFSFNEMADYDLPAMIDYVLNKTDQKQVYYLGFSQGNTVAFAALAGNPDLQKKIKLNFALGPLTRIRHLGKPLSTISKYESSITSMFNFFQIAEFLPAKDTMTNLMCTFIPVLCDFMITSLCGGSSRNYNNTRFHLYVTYIPSGTSSKNIVHYMQLVNSKLFRKFDYRTQKNWDYYHSDEPPLYDLQKISVPTVLITSKVDAIATPEDVEWMGKQLQHTHHIDVEDLNHMELVTAPSANVIYEKIIKIAKPG